MVSTAAENQLAQRAFAHQRKIGEIRRLLSRWLPRPVRQQIRRLPLLLLDGVDVVLGRRRELVPPRRLNFAGDGDFVANGNEFLGHFIDLGGLKPDDRVLDVGCGIGRMARPLTKYLLNGSYEGIDIVPEGIEWCRNNISRSYPNFRFQVADVHNLMYNPAGRFRAAEYRFPFKDGEFDFTFLTSVFTHMLRGEMERYLSEIARTLRPGGRCLITFFLLNDESRKLMTGGQSSLAFRFPLDGCWTDDERLPEHAVGFEETYLESLFTKLGFELEPARYGAWCGRNEYLGYQDIAVARKV